MVIAAIIHYRVDYDPKVVFMVEKVDSISLRTTSRRLLQLNQHVI